MTCDPVNYGTLAQAALYGGMTTSNCIPNAIGQQQLAQHQHQQQLSFGGYQQYSGTTLFPPGPTMAAAVYTNQGDLQNVLDRLFRELEEERALRKAAEGTLATLMVTLTKLEQQLSDLRTLVLSQMAEKTGPIALCDGKEHPAPRMLKTWAR